MNITCAYKADCYPCYESPIENLSLEGDDTLRYACIRFGPVPPVNIISPNGCITVYYSEVSQEDACLGAERNTVTCPCIVEPCGPPASYLNTPQTCSFTCPDGTVFTYTVPAGTFAGTSQLDADTRAYSYACQQAAALRECMGVVVVDPPDGGSFWTTYGLNAVCCAGSAFSGYVSTFPAVDASFSIASGSLPPGLTAVDVGSSYHISGTPTTAGTYSFVVQSVYGFGVAFRTVTIRVVKITPATLPDGAPSAAYSETLTATGALTGWTWSIVSGALPTGLTLNSLTGVISGTVDSGASGDYGFSVAIGDSTFHCEANYIITVAGGPCTPWTPYISTNITATTFHRPLKNGLLPPYTLGLLGTATSYDVVRFRVTHNGVYSFSNWTPSWDSYGVLYVNTFVPADPLCGYTGTPPPPPTCCLLAAEGGDITADYILFTYALQSGLDYYYVTCGFDNPDQGGYILDITSPDGCAFLYP